MSEFKVCTCCKEIKSVSEFWKHKKTKDGLREQCCHCKKRDWHLKNRDKYNEYSKNYKLKNKEKVNLYQRLQTNKITDSYIVNGLGLKNAPQELIEAKRIQILIHRKLKNENTKHKTIA